MISWSIYLNDILNMIKVSGNITEYAESTLESLYGSPEASQYYYSFPSQQIL